ncbi:MAG: cytochrome c oxidase subunit II [Paracoccaceae bacterium]
MMLRSLSALLTAIFLTAPLARAQDAGDAAAAAEPTGKPLPGGVNLQRPVTEHFSDLVWLDNVLLYVITAISLFVLALLLIVIVRFNKKANPEPARFTHNAPLEVAWTAIPVLILIAIAIPSLRLLDKQLTIPEPEVTIKATGYQWYWGYEYPDEGIDFTAYPVGLYASSEEERAAELEEAGYEPSDYLLATDTRMIVPVDTNVHLLVTAADVIHNWAMPSFGIKTDAIPGRLNEAWFNVSETGTYFGQCSELCGMNHAYMPITVEVVSKEDYAAWVAEQQAAADGMRDVAELAD